MTLTAPLPVSGRAIGRGLAVVLKQHNGVVVLEQEHHREEDLGKLVDPPLGDARRQADPRGGTHEKLRGQASLGERQPRRQRSGRR